MQSLVLDDADTALPVTIKADGREVTQVLDLAGLAVDLSAINKKAGSDSRAWLQGVADYMETLGFPKVSLTTADRFWHAVNAALAELKKKDGASQTPASPASTTPASSGSTPGNGSSSSSTSAPSERKKRSAPPASAPNPSAP